LLKSLKSIHLNRNSKLTKKLKKEADPTKHSIFHPRKLKRIQRKEVDLQRILKTALLVSLKNKRNQN